MSQSSKKNRQNEFSPRIGWISEIHTDRNRVKVDFYENPIGQPVWAAIGRAFTKSDIEMAIDNQLDCKIDFFVGDPNLPILVDIYSSLLDEELLVFRAKRIVIQGDEEVSIRSGEAQTSMTAKNSMVKTTAQHINSSAERVHKIQATKVCLN